MPFNPADLLNGIVAAHHLNALNQRGPGGGIPLRTEQPNTPAPQFPGAQVQKEHPAITNLRTALIAHHLQNLHELLQNHAQVHGGK